MISAFLLAGLSAKDVELPFTARVLLEELERYEKDIAAKARAAVSKKRAETISRLQLEATKQKRTSSPEVHAALIRKITDLQDQERAEVAAVAEAEKRWKPLMEPDNLPKAWTFPKNPDGGWSYDSGTLEMTSVTKYAAALCEVPPGDLILRAKLKMVGVDAPDGKEKQAGIGFLTGTAEQAVYALAQAPGAVIGFSSVGGEKILGMEKNTAGQRKFSEFQVAWVGDALSVFVNGKLVISSKMPHPRAAGYASLFANRAQCFVKEIEYRQPDSKDKERLAKGKAVD